MRPVSRLTRILAVALLLVLLGDQSLLFAAQQLPTTREETHVLVADQSQAPMRDNQIPGGWQCGHGCHFHNHFIGQIVHPPNGLFFTVGAETPAVFSVTRIATRPLEAPYRPPSL